MVHPLALTFLRHGMTKENEEKRYIGFTDVPLPEQEIRRLRSVSLDARIDLMVTSDLQRCRQTCASLLGHLAVPVYTKSQ